MAFVKVSKSTKQRMFREGGWRERDVMKNATCVTTSYGRKDCITFHDTKRGRKATYKIGRGWVN